MNIWFLIALGIWVFTSLIRNFYEGRKFQKSELRENKTIFRILIFAMFFMWSSWIFMSFSDPVKISFITWHTYPGIVLFAAGLVIFIISEATREGVTDKGFLVSKGLYSKIRHPMYLGQFLMAVGFPLYTGGLVTLGLSIFWLAQLLFWRASEEKELLAKYPEYREYIKRTWF
jgi:protein-S-isoprenylcysteine O-methyltransferase Ste14